MPTRRRQPVVMALSMRGRGVPLSPILRPVPVTASARLIRGNHPHHRQREHTLATLDGGEPSSRHIFTTPRLRAPCTPATVAE